ncbi:TPA: hypothetical protein N0F65_009127 [Lagenidium giganteum]|uniref:RING-type domain-containing protein n=1 Tax=Lagenidium giganteum TaxID=4803 RepID=A0AAV2YQ16_9STRA|nr:TPA: hypothetical protein N0F65_009127 [Lagenidium giganteum]
MVIDLQDTQPTDGVGDDLAHQIDLTRSSGSEAEAESDGDDDEVAIIASTRPPAPPVPPTLPAPSHNTPTPRRRKRRRSSGDGSNSSNKTAMFDMQRAESTSVSLENNDVIEQFKRALKCSICLDVMEDMTSTICGHVYCCKCIRLAIRVTGKCPLCQRKLLPKDIHGLYF